MSDSSTLKIHARVRMDEKAEDHLPPVDEEAGESVRVIRRKRRQKLSQGDRLLRNSAYACALLLGILALGNVEQPWAKKASESVERALTMHINLDESIGALEFVKRWMPESTLVFMNLSGETAFEKPVEGPVAHAFSNLQPWLILNCPVGSEVRAALAGTVTAVCPLSGGKYGVLVDHGDGVETLYAQLEEPLVATGDAISRGDAVGKSGDSVYFEYRKGGESVDPTGMLGL